LLNVFKTLEAYHQAVTYSKHADLYLDETPAVRERRNIRGIFSINFRRKSLFLGKN